MIKLSKIDSYANTLLIDFAELIKESGFSKTDECDHGDILTISYAVSVLQYIRLTMFSIFILVFEVNLFSYFNPVCIL